MLFLFSITWGTISGWWALVCIAAGLLYAWLPYKKPVSLKPFYRYLLFSFRAILVAVAAFLLIAPLVKSTSYNPQKPLILVLQDNSESVKLFNKVSPSGGDLEGAVNALSKLKIQLGDKYDVREFHFNHDIETGLTQAFNGKQTDIAKALHSLNEQFVNQNIGAVILATDGIYNQGSDPGYEAKNFKSTIYTVALGDTVPKRDLLISNINYNKTALLGNDFEAEILTEAYQANGETMHLSITEDGRQVYAQNIPVTANSFHKVVTVKLNADKKGLRKFNVSITPVSNELSAKNNAETVFIDVLDARQKVLLVYDAPHPDIGAIKQFIENNKNYEVKATLASGLSAINVADYSLFILYQISPAFSNSLQPLLKTKTPLWFVAGAQTDIQAFNNDQRLIKISVNRPDMQEVFAQPVNDFTDFTLSDSSLKKIAALPPLLAPFGNYSMPGNPAMLFKQKIGSIATTYPLLAFGEDAGRREAVLTGEGVWRWRLSEYEIYGNHHAAEELFSQSVQYLTANANRQRFTVYTDKHVFDEGEHVLLNAELYNDALELINTPDVKMNLKSGAGKNYSYLFSRSGQSYSLDAGALPAGEYTYAANTKIGDRPFAATGQVTIKALNLELMQSTANHKLLQTIAQQSGGVMIHPDELNKLASLIRKNDNVKTVVYEDKHYADLIDLIWLFFLIAGLLSLEWLIRKREGEI